MPARPGPEGSDVPDRGLRRAPWVTPAWWEGCAAIASGYFALRLILSTLTGDVDPADHVPANAAIRAGLIVMTVVCGRAVRSPRRQHRWLVAASLVSEFALAAAPAGTDAATMIVPALCVLALLTGDEHEDT